LLSFETRQCTKHVKMIPSVTYNHHHLTQLQSLKIHCILLHAPI